jgi:hypothetical protein
MELPLPPPHPSIEFSIASRGYSKGVAQTDGPQPVIRPEVAFGSLRLGAYAKTVTSSEYDGEAGALVGYGTTVGKTDLSGTVALKHLIDPVPGVDKMAIELAVSATRTIGDLRPRVSLTYSPNDLGSTGRTAFWEAGASYQIDKKTVAFAGIGLRRRVGGPDYSSFSTGLSRTLGGPLSIEARIYDTNKHRLGDYYHRRVVFALRARL